MPEKKRLLIVEDDYDVAEMLLAFFQSKQYEVYHADSGMNGIAAAHAHFPQVILLDVMMPDIDGYETCRRLRQMTLTRYIPVIFLTQRDERANKVKGLELGADDYITKPFDIEELRLRVESVIRRATRENLHEPRTGLPSGPLVEEEMARRRYGQSDSAEMHFRVEGYRAYHDVYGFLAGNDVFGYAAKIIQQVISEHGTPDDFIGIIDDQFVVLTTAVRADLVRHAIDQRFREGVRAFYNYGDAEQGGIRLDSGSDSEQFVPLMSLHPLQPAQQG